MSSITLDTRKKKMEEYLKKQSLVKDLMKDVPIASIANSDLWCFLNVEKLAENFVGEIITTAKQTVWHYHQQLECTQLGQSDLLLRDAESQESGIEFVEVFGSFEEWPKIGQFTIEMGADRISDYLATWHYEEDWLYDLDMMLAESDACSDFYIYEVKWSIPTPEYPIPQATASIFFTVEVSRVLPKECYVNVTYKFEGSDYKHEPFKHAFQERWLFNIIESKLKFFRRVTF